MTLIRYNPVFRNKYEPYDGTTSWSPAVDIIENDNAISLDIDLPGLTKSEFTLNVKEGVLRLHGERKRVTAEDEKHYQFLERPYGVFERVFRLPEHIDGEQIKASYRNGVLKLELPKKEETKPRTIQITA